MFAACDGTSPALLERGRHDDTLERETSYDLTSRPYIANAEVAEWQTQRTQKTSEINAFGATTHDSAHFEKPTQTDSDLLDPSPPRSAAVSRYLVEGALETLDAGNLPATRALLLLALREAES